MSLEKIVKIGIASILALAFTATPAEVSEFPYRVYNKTGIKMYANYFPRGASIDTAFKERPSDGAKNCQILEFMTNGTYYASNGKSIGIIRSEYETQTKGISKKGCYLGWNAVDGLRPLKEENGDPFLMGGLVRLIDNYEIDSSGYQRGINPNGNCRRIAIGFKGDNFFIVSGNYTLSGITRKMKGYNVSDAVLLDGGGAAMHYDHDGFHMKPHRAIRTVIYGVQR